MITAVPSTTTFSYVTTGTAVTSAAVTGVVYPTLIADQLATLTMQYSHGWERGQLINVSDGLGDPFKGIHVITSIPDSTKLCFKVLPSMDTAQTGNTNTAVITSVTTPLTVKGSPGFTVAANYGNNTEWTSSTDFIGTSPSIQATNPETKLLIDKVESYLSDKKLIGSVVYGEGVEWTNADVSVSVAVLPLYNQESVRAAVQAAVVDVFSYDNVDFGKRITAGDVYKSILSVDGVDYATINKLAKTGTTGTIENINDPLINPENAKRMPRINPLINTVYPNGWVTATGGLTKTVV
jgi:hypothetical protein